MIKMRKVADFLCPVCGMAVYLRESKETRGQWRAKCYWCGLKTDWTGSREEAAAAWAEVDRYWKEWRN